jgi:transcriptional regulator with XRE-family HTH domain
MKAKLKKYTVCVKALESKGLSRRQIAGLIGIDEAVVSRRMAGKQEPTREALIVINTLADIFSLPEKEDLTAWDGRGWINEKINQSVLLNELGRVA